MPPFINELQFEYECQEFSDDEQEDLRVEDPDEDEVDRRVRLAEEARLRAVEARRQLIRERQDIEHRRYLRFRWFAYFWREIERQRQLDPQRYPWFRPRPDPDMDRIRALRRPIPRWNRVHERDA